MEVVRTILGDITVHYSIYNIILNEEPLFLYIMIVQVLKTSQIKNLLEKINIQLKKFPNFEGFLSRKKLHILD